MATPEPLCATALVSERSPPSRLVKRTPVIAGSWSVKPALPPAPGLTALLLTPLGPTGAASAARIKEAKADATTKTETDTRRSR